MSRIFLVLLALVALTFAACSYAVEFVVVNESGRPVEVQLKYFDAPDDSDLAPKVMGLSTANASQLRDGDRDWRRLAGAQPYRLDRASRTVTVTVRPGDALLIQQLSDWNVKDGKPLHFSVERLIIAGASGSIRLEGKQVPGAFTREGRLLYVLAYK